MNFLFPRHTVPGPNGVVVRSIGGVKRLSMWSEDTELIATLDKEQAAHLSRALTDRSGVFQVVGPVRLFNIPKINL